MNGDARPANDAPNHPGNDAGSLKPYWIAGTLITLAAIACVWYTNDEIAKSKPAEVQLARPTYKTSAAQAAVSENSNSGMKKAGLENTRTPQVGKASGEDGAPKPPSSTENPNDLDQ